MNRMVVDTVDGLGACLSTADTANGRRRMNAMIDVSGECYSNVKVMQDDGNRPCDGRLYTAREFFCILLPSVE